MCRLAKELGELQPGDLVSFQGVGEVVWTIISPGDTAMLQDDIVSVADAEPWVVMWLNIRVGRCRPVVEQASGIRRPPVQGDGDVLQPDIANAALRCTAHTNAVLGPAANILDAYVVDGSDLCFRGARDRCERDGLASAPPRVRVVPRDEFNVTEVDVVDAAFITQLDVEAPAAQGD